MSSIRDQGLLTVRTLAILPNDKDNLNKFYEPMRNRLVQEFREKDLVPMKQGGHAKALGIFRSSKALSDLINDSDMVALLGGNYSPPIWAANPSQRNQPDDNFLTMLGIDHWNTEDLLQVLWKMNADTIKEWMGGKGVEWHQRLYEMLADSSHYYLKSIPFVRCSDLIYREGNDCFFQNDSLNSDDKFPRVDPGIYLAGEEE